MPPLRLHWILMKTDDQTQKDSIWNDRTWSSLHRVLRSSMRSRLVGDSWMSWGPKVDANWFMCVTSSLIGEISSWNSCIHAHAHAWGFFCVRTTQKVVLLECFQRRQMGSTDRLLVWFSLVSHLQCSNIEIQMHPSCTAPFFLLIPIYLLLIYGKHWRLTVGKM